jgi:hypothetical protein
MEKQENAEGIVLGIGDRVVVDQLNCTSKTVLRNINTKLCFNNSLATNQQH